MRSERGAGMRPRAAPRPRDSAYFKNDLTLLSPTLSRPFSAKTPICHDDVDLVGQNDAVWKGGPGGKRPRGRFAMVSPLSRPSARPSRPPLFLRRRR